MGLPLRNSFRDRLVPPNFFRVPNEEGVWRSRPPAPPLPPPPSPIPRPLPEMCSFFERFSDRVQSGEVMGDTVPRNFFFCGSEFVIFLCGFVIGFFSVYSLLKSFTGSYFPTGESSPAGRATSPGAFALFEIPPLTFDPWLTERSRNKLSTESSSTLTRPEILIS